MALPLGSAYVTVLGKVGKHKSSSVSGLLKGRIPKLSSVV